jgi:DNA-binding transcriptional LysR family regulator
MARMDVPTAAPRPPGAGPRVDLDLRKLRYFVAVAEELHFGRAAERLFLAQPVLSRQIRKLEQELGAELLVRSSRHVELTDAGRRLAEEARPLLAAADTVTRRVRMAAERLTTLTVGFFIGDPVARLAKAFSAMHPEVTVELVRIYWSDQMRLLREGGVDVAFVHRPVDEDGLDLVRLYAEPRLALLPADHRLADRERVQIADLADDPVILHRGADPAWEAFHNTDPRADGRRPRPGPTVSNIEEKLEHVAAGRAISFVPASAAAAIHPRPDVVAIPVDDILPTEIALAWRQGNRSSVVEAFVRTARAVFGS